MEEHFEELCARALDGRATEGELAALQSLLRGDLECRRLYREQTGIHALLAWQHGAAGAAPSGMEAVSAKILGFPRHRGPWGWAAAAAAVVAVACFFFQRKTSEPKADGVKLEIVAAEKSGWRPGQTSRASVISQESGALSFRLPNGVMVKTTTPVTLELISETHLRLLRGAVQVDAGEHGKGFVVETAETRVVDLGTAFSVAVSGHAETDVAVLSGVVELHPPPSHTAEKTITLTEGEAVTVGSLWRLRRLQAVAIRGEGLGIVEGVNGGEPVVTNISDGINDTGFHRFYSIRPGGMKPGVRASSTHGRPLWQAMPGADFPAELLGADVIGTFMLDRFERRLALEIEVACPCTLYLLLDERSPVPDWVQRDYRRTAFQLRSGPWPAAETVVTGIPPDDDGLRFVSYNVWSRDVPQAGKVTLGSPPLIGDVRHQAMFGIAAKSKAAPK